MCLTKVPVNRNGPDMPGVIFSDNGSPNVPKVGQLQDVLQVIDYTCQKLLYYRGIMVRSCILEVDELLVDCFSVYVQHGHSRDVCLFGGPLGVQR